MVRAGILLAVVGALLAGIGAFFYARVVAFPQLTADLVLSITWICWALGGVFLISGTGAVLTNRKRPGGPT